MSLVKLCGYLITYLTSNYFLLFVLKIYRYDELIYNKLGTGKWNINKSNFVWFNDFI